MCGFAGFVSRDVGQAPEETLERMGEAIIHRGPDDAGVWVRPELGVGLVHRRLAIQDLSPAGAQPMASASGRFVIAFNGEIYNFRQLRSELEGNGCSFRGHSDTEVMLNAIECWGLEASLPRFSGMFAFALVDLRERTLVLARDRMGEKPLYYGWQNSTLMFGSELKALRAHPAWHGGIEPGALALLLRHNVIPAPISIHKGIFKLPPASLVTFCLDESTPGSLPEPQRYWRLEECFREGRAPESFEAASDQLESLLGSVIEDQMVSDVPLGAFLSGGIDSSTVVALMQARANQNVKTFSIGFDEPGFNEAQHAAEVARHLGTDHTELYVTPDDALSLVPRLPELYDEPFADSSQLPTFLVSQMTRKHVTVALSGDGGDELFCGYTRYPSVSNRWQARNSAGGVARRCLARLPEVPTAQAIRALAPSQRGRSTLAIRHRLKAERALASASDLSEFYRQSVSFWNEPECFPQGVQEPRYGLNQPMPPGVPADDLKTLMWRDLNWYLPDDILVKVDRAAMACSLETRIPMLSPEVVSFALSLPLSYNLKGGVGKQVLRSVLYRHVPRSLVDRPKQGFAVPVGQWLRGPLRPWAEALLQPSVFEKQDYLDRSIVNAYWQEHLTGREDYSAELWSILMFLAWLERTGG
ncbi:asparagine synthase (glutamine-hydrolyzing) [Marinobacter daepoensis]|uniref:asparagine synthase (glutamine-hydrolyzing) n=1 Tax=Marinobacter daepoensis TaxID=262077 RepID=UPI001C96D7D0|nr:asparagine synthase (glutamine-hydrolyzing) [Marinobacter daepoensis]MBY6032514.1 asparagine synthase (glutamine-hydrolyzing) [Marinobacter daepoensis]